MLKSERNSVACRGFGALSLVVATMFLAGLGIALLSTVRVEKSTVYSDKAAAIEIIQQGRDLAETFRRMVIRGSSPASIRYSLGGPGALFEEAQTGMTPPRVPPAALDTSKIQSNNWIYRSGSGNFLGRSQVYWFVLGEVRDGVCDQVNLLVSNGKPSDLPVTGAEIRGSNLTVIPELSTLPNPVDLSAWTNGSSRAPDIGCVRSESGGNYIFSIAQQG